MASYPAVNVANPVGPGQLNPTTLPKSVHAPPEIDSGHPGPVPPMINQIPTPLDAGLPGIGSSLPASEPQLPNIGLGPPGTNMMPPTMRPPAANPIPPLPNSGLPTTEPTYSAMNKPRPPEMDHPNMPMVPTGEDQDKAGKVIY